MKNQFKKYQLLGLLALFCSSCNHQAGNNKIIIYTNADDEAKKVMEQTLNESGFENQYIMQTFSTSELSGRLLAEGKNIEANLVTMSSYFLDSAQNKNNMFIPLTFERKTLQPCPNFYAPITSQEGTIFYNTKELAAKSLMKPSSLKELGDPQYKNLISIPDINSSSTAWLFTQAIISEYGQENEGKKIINSILENAGPHIEQSGSAPLNKVRAGEVVFGFGLRQQAIADKIKGLPIDIIDPSEGNFSLTEAIAVIDKDANTNSKAMKMAAAIIKNGRSKLQKYYPNPLYENEPNHHPQKSIQSKTFAKNLTVELLEKHKKFFHNKY